MGVRSLRTVRSNFFCVFVRFVAGAVLLVLLLSRSDSVLLLHGVDEQ